MVCAVLYKKLRGLCNASVACVGYYGDMTDIYTVITEEREQSDLTSTLCHTTTES